MRRVRRLVRLLPLAALVLTSTACVEEFDGSWMEFVLGRGVQVPADTGNGAPPTDTHYEFWVVTGGRAFKLTEFEVVRQIERTHPCFVEDDDSRFPGLHSTRIYDKTREAAMAAGSPGGAMVTDEEAGLMADAQERASEQLALEEQLKAVVSYDPTLRPDDLVALEAAVPDPAMFDDASNAMRRTVCQDFFATHPLAYVGNDKVFSLPLNGVWHGMVDGTDPRNAAFVGGAGFSVTATFKQFDEFWMTWQFNDANDPRIADFGGASPTGYPYMNGKPEYRTRRIINVQLSSEQFPFLTGDVAIYPGIDEDYVHF